MLEEAAPIAQDHATSPRNTIYGLDGLRFIAALWVAFSHGARFPIDRVLAPDTTAAKVIHVLAKTTFNGTAAVTVFFVLSGFIIHRANVGQRRVDALPFWIRRGVRIGGPLIAIVAVAALLGSEYTHSLSQVLWSVYAEIIYYALYPLLLPLLTRFGSTRVLIASLVMSLGLLLTAPTSIYLWSFGAWTWLFCAPLWLLGCVLAEHEAAISGIASRVSVWFFRLGALLYCLASTILATHAGSLAVGYTWTIIPFGLFCVVWIAAEMRSYRAGKATLVLSRLGLGSYALYLVYKLPITFFEKAMTDIHPVAYWLLLLAAIGASTFAMYRLIEWPSHQLARRWGKAVRA